MARHYAVTAVAARGSFRSLQHARPRRSPCYDRGMTHRTFIVACSLSALTFTAVSSARLAGAAQGAPVAVEAGEQIHDEKADQALLETVCGACHESALVAGPFRTPAEWDEAIGRMQSYGATATDDQFGQVRAHLLRT